MKKVVWSDWLLILVVLGFICFVVMQSCAPSAYQKRNRCVRKYLDYYTTGTLEQTTAEVSKRGIGTEEREKSSGFMDIDERSNDPDRAFERIAALCLLDDDDLVKYIFETEYQEEE